MNPSQVSSPAFVLALLTAVPLWTTAAAGVPDAAATRVRIFPRPGRAALLKGARHRVGDVGDE